MRKNTDSKVNNSNLLDQIPDSTYFENYELWKQYGSGTLKSGKTYRVNISRNHNMVCYVWEANAKRFDKPIWNAIVGTEDFNKMRNKLK